jgi:hypothetical protein
MLYVGFFRSFALELIHFIHGLNTAMYRYGKSMCFCLALISYHHP